MTDNHDPSASANSVATVSYRLTAQDLVDVQRSAFLRQIGSWRRLALPGAVLSFLVVLGIMNRQFGLAFILLIASVLTVLLPWLWTIPQAARLNFAQTRSLRDETHLEWTKHGLRLWSDNQNVFTPWADCRFWLETPRSILLYQADLAFQFVPKRILSPDELGSLRRSAEAANIPGLPTGR